MSSSERLDQVLSQYAAQHQLFQFFSLNLPPTSQYPDIRKLTQLLNDVTHDEKVRLLKSRRTLYTAARIGHTAIILSSVPQHQRLDVLLVGESTPLHTAADWGKSDSVETILTHLTPEQQLEILSVRDGEGKTPADKASRWGREKIERLLRDYQKTAEKQINKARKNDNTNQGYFLSRELQQTKLQLDSQAKDIQTLTSAVTALDTSNKNKDEILLKITEESKEFKSTVQKLNEKISKQTAEAAKCQTENGKQRDQILKQQTDITELRDELRATGRQHQLDVANQKLHYETKLTEQQEQITRQQEQITRQQEQITQLRDEMRASIAVRHLAMSSLKDRHEVLGTTCTNLRYDVDRIDETVGNLTGVVERIDEQFFPDTNAVGRGAPYDGGDEVVEEQWTVPQPATNA